MRVDPSSTRTLRHADPIVQEVLDIWTARFIAGQIPLGDITAALANIDSWQDWGPEWMRIAAVHEDQGTTAWEEGRRISAVGSFLTAARAYHLSYFLSVEDEEQHRRGLEKMVECHDRVLDYQEPSVEKVAIPFPEHDLTGLLSLPRGDSPSPLVIVLPGLDSTKETRHGSRGPLLRRGMGVLSLDGPGQGEMSTRLPLRHDYEVAVAAAIDSLEQRGDVDTRNIGLIGASLGGYYACRAAAFEPRLRAVVANGGPYDWGEVYDELPLVTRSAFRHYSWSQSEAEAREMAKALTLEGVAEKILQPLVVVHGQQDPLIPAEHARRIASEAADAVLIEVENGVHGVNNLSYRFAPWVNDWMARQLGATTA
ncbi:MAG TPA: alpha/beta fold hydrolase [Acidimicrobiia bacterium]|nr:alpha/beta fold hydrolase [Acidimicrobiia bacterium]